MATLVFSLVFMVLVVGTLGGWAVREQRRRTPDGPKFAEERRIP
jgi:heme/copper-type cytochrome/quinol oxidase subunit 2